MKRHNGLRTIGGLLLTVTVLLSTLYVPQVANMDDVEQYIGTRMERFDAASMSMSGSAQIIDGTLALTTGEPNQIGFAFDKQQYRMSSDRSFSAYFSFAISSTDPAGGGEGFQFVMRVPGSNPEKDKAYQGMPESFAIEFDTQQDPSLPIPVEPSSPHISVLEGGDLTDPLATSPQSFADGKTHYVWVEYNGMTNRLEVRMSSTGERPADAIIGIDSTIPLTDVVEIGFTAASSSKPQMHQIHSLQFSQQLLMLGPNVASVKPENVSIEVVESSSAPAAADVVRSRSVTVVAKNNQTGKPISGVPLTFEATNDAQPDRSGDITDQAGICVLDVKGGESTDKAKNAVLTVEYIGSKKQTLELGKLRKNTPPDVQAGTKPEVLSTFENTELRFSDGFFNMYYYDADGDDFVSIAIDEAPDQGELLLGDKLIGLDEIIAKADLSKLVYIPPADFVTEEDQPLQIKWYVSDGMALSNDVAVCHIQVKPVNHAPTFKNQGNVGLGKDEVDVSRPGWAFDISPGSPNEKNQKLTFEVIENSNPALFSELPSITEDGTLNFKIASGQNGTSELGVILKDDGDTENGGMNISEMARFMISFDTVKPVIRIPVIGEGWSNQPFWSEMICMDEESGVATFAYAVTADSTAPAALDNSIIEGESGRLYLHYRAVDKAGNIAEGTQGPFSIDRQAPKVQDLQVQLQDGKIVASAKAEDVHSGVQSLVFAINGTWYPPMDPNTAKIEIRNLVPNALYAVSVRAVDKAGNASSVLTQTVIVPHKQPKLKKEKRNNEMVLTIDPAGNAIDTQYRILCKDRSGAILWESDWSTQLNYTQPERPDAEYSLEIQPKLLSQDSQQALAKASQQTLQSQPTITGTPK